MNRPSVARSLARPASVRPRCSRRAFPRPAVAGLLLAVALLGRAGIAPAAPFTNGDFENDADDAWRRDGADVPRHVVGDRAHYAQTGIGRIARVGDRDGRDANGENPSRFYQRFDASGDGNAIVVTFKFRSSLARTETAWVRLAAWPEDAAGDESTPEHVAAWRLPPTNGEWRGPATIALPGCAGDVTLEFGIERAGAEAVAGTLDVDDVTASCSTLAETPPPDDLDLPPLPRGGADQPLPLVLPHGPTGPGIAALVVAAVFVTAFLGFVIKKSREPAPPDVVRHA
ncbi:MAG: hypothetical protein KC591_00725 [Gemmatimonadetes bacterium]|nr:hypothetical protein [Gemmatimonadota bacterium]